MQNMVKEFIKGKIFEPRLNDGFFVKVPDIKQEKLLFLKWHLGWSRTMCPQSALLPLELSSKQRKLLALAISYN